jgi:Tfp pilus assembly protein PilF
MFSQAKAAALKAIEIDPTLAEAHSAAAALAWAYDWDWTRADQEFQRAVQLDPNSSIVHSRYSIYLANMLRPDEAVAECKKAVQLDPLSPIVTGLLGYALTLSHRFDEATPWYQKALELEPGFTLARAELGWNYAFKGDAAAGLAEHRKIPQLPTVGEDQLISAGLAYIYALNGNRREALETIAQFKKLSADRYIDNYLVATVYAGVGDKDHAFECLSRAVTERSASIGFLKADPFMERLRSDPRFAALLHRVGLPE